MINKGILKHRHNHSEKDLYRAYKIFFNTLASEHRLRILNLLRKKPLNVSEIMEKTRVEQTVVSHNLKKLLFHGFVFHKKSGKYRYYALNENTARPLLDLIDKHMEDFCMKIIQQMKGGKKNELL